jgi:hypothetical protein
VTELTQRQGESLLSWLTRLAAMDSGSLTPAQRRARVAFMAEARRLCQEEQQRARWRRAGGGSG